MNEKRAPHFYGIAIFTVFAVLLLAAPVNGLTWTIETVDSNGRVGFESSLALDNSGNPHISYVDFDNGNLKYAVKNGGKWTIEVVDSNGRYPSLSVDSTGNPCISYSDLTNGDLKYAEKNGGKWLIETVDSTGIVGRDPSLILDSTGDPRISYSDPANGDLKYAEKDGGKWTIEVVDSTGNVGLGNSLALDSTGKPRISYFDWTNENLKYAEKNGGKWTIEVVDSTGNVAVETSLALDSDDNPRISYYSEGVGLKYAMKNGVVWDIYSDRYSMSSPRSSLALDNNDNPRISYSAIGEGLKYLAKNGDVWTIYTVDIGEDTRNFRGQVGDPSLVLDRNDKSYISYCDWANGNLKYAVQQSKSDSDSVSLNVPIFRQNVGNWSDDRLGRNADNSGDGSGSIGTYGCAVTSAAMVFSAYGTPVNPGELNEWLKNNNGFERDLSGTPVEYDGINWIRAADISKKDGANTITYEGIRDYSNGDANVEEINSLLNDGYPVIAQVFFSKFGRYHWVVITGYKQSNGNTIYTIHDPYSHEDLSPHSAEVIPDPRFKDFTNLGAKGTINKIQIYKGPTTSTLSQQVQQSSQTQLGDISNDSKPSWVDNILDWLTRLLKS